jgi:import receptor subunit TOM20
LFRAFFLTHLLSLLTDMAVKTSTIALISTAIAAAFGVGYLIYFDQKRRSDPHFKKQMSK